MLIGSDLAMCSPVLNGRTATATVAVLGLLCGVAIAEQQSQAKKADQAAQLKKNVEEDTAAVSPLLQGARDFIARRVADGDLQGAWFQIDEKDGVLEVLSLLDSGKAEKQTQVAEQIEAGLAEAFPSAKFVFREPVLRPVSQLVENLQLHIEASMSYPGVGISAATFTVREKTDGGVQLSLQGRVASREQREKIRDLCVEMMQKDPYWGKKRPDGSAPYEDAYPDGKQLKVVVPSQVFSSRLFNRGLSLFWSGQTAEARKHFRASMIESRGSVPKHYWLVLCELQLGETDRARNLLREPLNRIRKGTLQQEAVLWSLQRVQGPLRWKLIALENEMMLDVK